MPERMCRGLKGALLVFALALGGCAHGSSFGEATPANDPDINVPPANYKPEIVAAMHAYLADPTGIRDAGIAQPALKTVGGNLRYVVCLRFNAKKRGTEYAGIKEVSAVFVAGRFDRFAEIPKGESADEHDRCAGIAYTPFPELEKLSR
ncbi:MAG: hypothetical protein WA851_08240 [Xanthobacteraceae bacterium]